MELFQELNEIEMMDIDGGLVGVFTIVGGVLTIVYYTGYAIGSLRRK